MLFTPATHRGIRARPRRWQGFPGPDWSKQMKATAISDLAPARRLWGRQAEVETLSSRLSALQAGRGGAVLVAGLAGLGKTVLLDAVEAAARTAGVAVLP